MMASMLAVADEALEPEVEVDEELEAAVGGSSEERAALSLVGEAEEVGGRGRAVEAPLGRIAFKIFDEVVIFGEDVDGDFFVVTSS